MLLKTEFASTSGMDKTELFKDTFSAREVAQDGYNGMLSGKLNVMAGLTFAQKIMMATIPLTPKKMLLSQIRKMQEVKKLKSWIFVQHSINWCKGELFEAKTHSSLWFGSNNHCNTFFIQWEIHPMRKPCFFHF